MKPRIEYIYESPDGGRTVYRRPMNKPNAARELVSAPPEKLLEMTIDDNGIITIIDYEKDIRYDKNS